MRHRSTGAEIAGRSPMLGTWTRTALAMTMVSAACTSGDNAADDDAGAGADDFDPLVDGKADGLAPEWTVVGRGVAYHRVNAGNAILIAYGGYSAKLAYSTAWATELVDAKLGAADVGHVYAVQGPADPGYNAKEIQNTRLRAHLKTIDNGAAGIYVVAHSSGSYVAHEMLGQMVRASTFGALARIAYANLDGGGSGLTDELVDSLREITFVYAHDPTLASGLSQNSSTAKALGDAYAPHATAFEVVVPSTGCVNGAGWCMHDVVITHRPHNHTTFDLAHDYTDFVNRTATTEYLDPLLPPP